MIHSKEKTPSGSPEFSQPVPSATGFLGRGEWLAKRVTATAFLSQGLLPAPPCPTPPTHQVCPVSASFLIPAPLGPPSSLRIPLQREATDPSLRLSIEAIPVPVPGGRGLTFKDDVRTIKGFYVNLGGPCLSLSLSATLAWLSFLSLGFLRPPAGLRDTHPLHHEALPPLCLPGAWKRMAALKATQ